MVAEILLIIALGLLLNLPIGIAAFRKQSLTVPGGILTAGMVGFILFIANYILWGLLFFFFVSSTILTKFNENSELKINAMQYAEKGGERDSLQVLANGGTALLGSIFILLIDGILFDDHLSPIFLLIAVSIASSTADTWSTEIGTTSTTDPVWIFNWKKRVPRGTSGGVSLKGTIASLLGSIFVASIYLLIVIISNDFIVDDQLITFVLYIAVGGFLGGLIDTIMGATVQAVFECPSCNKLTEKTKHPRCENIPTNYTSGWKWLNNDGVNFLSSLMASLIFVSIYIIIV